MAVFKKVRCCSGKWNPAFGDKDTWFTVVNLDNVAYAAAGNSGTVTLHFVGGPAPLLCVGHVDDFLEKEAPTHARVARA